MQDLDSLIEFVLRHPVEISKRVLEKRLEITGGGHTGGGTSGHSRVSDPTALEAIRKVAPIGFIYCPYGPAINGRRDERLIKLPEKWLIVEEMTRLHYMKGGESESRRLIKEIYKRRYQQGEYGEKWELTCDKLQISKGFYYAVVHDVIRFAGLYAAGINLISPYGRF